MAIKCISSQEWENKLLSQIDANEIIKSDDLNEYKNIVKKEEREFFIPRFYSWPVIFLFITSNIIVFTFIVCAAYQDITHLSAESYQRFLTQKVIMSLIAGTVTQTGLAFYLLGKIYSSKINATDSSTPSSSNSKPRLKP